MDIYELILGQILEAIYFVIFMIYVKNIKKKRILFTFLVVLEEVLLINAFQSTVWFNVLYIFIMYLLLKVLYKEEAQIIDVFTFSIGSLILLLINSISYVLFYRPFRNFILYVVLDRILLFIFLLILKNKLNKIQFLYKKLWNRNDKIKKKIKTTTFRCINLIIFNLMFYIANIVLIYITFI